MLPPLEKFNVQRIRLSEWILIFLHLILHAEWSLEGFSVYSNVITYTAFLGLSFIFPLSRERIVHILYVVSGLLLAIAGNFLGVPTDLLLYLYLAKGCLLLNKRDCLLIVFFAGSLWLTSEVNSAYDFTQSAEILPNLPDGVIDNRSAILFSSLGIYLGGATFVVLLCFSIQAEQESRRRVELLSQQAEELAAALERSRIARDIHDSLGHTLTNLNIQLQLAQRLRTCDSWQANQAIDLPQELSVQCIEDLNCALNTVRQADFNLNQAIECLINQSLNNSATYVESDLLLPPLPLQQRYQIYFIIKECLVNIQKHAQASHVFLYAIFTQKELNLRVEDNGIGFNPSTVSSGFGLRGLAERVQILGGKLEITSRTMKGTSIEIRIPL